MTRSCVRCSRQAVGAAVAVLVAVLWFWAGIASAATVSGNPDELRYQAAPGEVNVLTVTAVGADVQLADSGAPISAGAVCTVIDAHTVRCPAPTDFLNVLLAGGDDHLTMVGALPTLDVILEGGPGDDVLNGGPGTDGLFGEAGSDTIRGGGGNDLMEAGDPGVTPDSPGAHNVLSGGLGDDHLTCDCRRGSNSVSGDAGDDTLLNGSQDGNTSDDVYSGGGGVDTVSYFVPFLSNMTAPDARPRFITLDGTANDGRSGEHDNVMPDVENVEGAYGPDRIVGDNADNVLRGWSGADVILGGGGNDTLSGWRGPDLLHGGGGDDHLLGLSGFDRLFGDLGVDVCLTGAGGGTRHGCES